MNCMRLGSFAKERWLPLVFGAACLVAVLIVVRHFSHEEEFASLASQTDPYWLLAALGLQAATYFAQGEIWRNVAGNSGSDLSVWTVYRLALIKLFVDQVVPSAGFSGALAVARMLGRHALSRHVVSATLVISTTSFFFAYIVSLAGALMILLFTGYNTAFVVVPSILFMISAVALSFAMIVLSGRNLFGQMGRFARLAVVLNAMSAMKEADAELVRNVNIQLRATLYQVATFVLDGLTLWMLLRSLGIAASPAHAFASFMIANLVRTIGIIPAGLGTFEATAVLMLKMDGISVAAALSAIVLFRLVTFILPMMPGLWFSRHLVRRHHPHPSEFETLS
jgi:uncharacterized protein (TIRG00374 family)